MKKVMIRAWEIARAAVVKFGGSVKSFFSQSLKMAWAEIKKGVVTMIELVGSEKQVAWANEIRNTNIRVLERELSEFKQREVYENYSWARITDKLELALEEIKTAKPEAKWWIEHKNVANAFLYKIKQGGK